MKWSKIFIVSLFVFVFGGVHWVYGTISKEEAQQLLQIQFQNKSEKNVDAYQQCINAGMTNDQAIENLDKIKDMTQGGPPVLITGGQWSYDATGHVSFSQSSAFIPAVPESKRNMHYTSRRAKHIKEVVPEENHGDITNKAAEKYNDAYNDVSSKIKNSGGLENSSYGKQILQSYGHVGPNSTLDDLYDDINRMNSKGRMVDKIKAFAGAHHVPLDKLNGYAMDPNNPGHLKSLATTDGKTYLADGSVIDTPNQNSTGGNPNSGNPGGGASVGNGAGTGGGGASVGNGAGTGGGGSGEGLVPCGGVDATNKSQACTICHLIEGIHGIIKFIVNLIWVTGILVITIAGVIYIVSSGNESTTTLAKTAIKNALIGVAIVLTAFMLITFILNRVLNVKYDKIKGLEGIARQTWNFNCKNGSENNQSNNPIIHYDGHGNASGA